MTISNSEKCDSQTSYIVPSLIWSPTCLSRSPRRVQRNLLALSLTTPSLYNFFLSILDRSMSFLRRKTSWRAVVELFLAPPPPRLSSLALSSTPPERDDSHVSLKARRVESELSLQKKKKTKNKSRWISLALGKSSSRPLLPFLLSFRCSTRAHLYKAR